MIGALFENLFDAFLRPRRSVRRLIDGGHGLDAALLLVLLGYLARAIFVLVTPGARMFDGAMPMAGYLIGLIEAYLTFGILVIAVHHVGRLFGGTGTLPGAAIAMAWYQLVVSVLTPFVASASVAFIEAVKAASENPDTPPELPGGSMLILSLSLCVMMWLLASYVAELHRFERTWNVLSVMIGLSMGISILGIALTQGVV
ncbi:MAG TPA: YIP1 family protein [Thermohalobaculum sp.]|nr:YIP1 family protein [Thermohalobaculum sp.]